MASMSPLVEVRPAGESGNGCFVKKCVAGGGIQAGTTLLEGARPIVWVVNDGHESTACR